MLQVKALYFTRSFSVNFTILKRDFNPKAKNAFLQKIVSGVCTLGCTKKFD